ncbi:MAG: hypothetical protein Q8S20_10585 [Sulfuritalea sp.]|nr:hypothetical protein [Sulfuritalea sp.]
MNPILFAAVLAISLAGCAATADLSPAYALHEKQPEGLAIVSLTLTGKALDKMSGFEYRIREVPPRDEEAVVATSRYASARQHARSLQDGGSRRQTDHRAIVKEANGIEPLDIRDATKTTGRLATLRLPPGDYEFHAWKASELNAYGETEYGPPRDFSYRFSIEPGVATYIGRLSLNLSERNTQRITVEDRRNDDLAILREKYPAIDIGQIVFGVGTLHP